MRMWIGCLASYNNGRLIGEWSDVSTDSDENAAEIARVLKASPVPGAEEAFIADYEAPRALADLLGEYPGAEALAQAATIEEAVDERYQDSDDLDAVLGVMLDGRRSCDLADLDVEDWLSECIAGEGDNLADWAMNFLDETDFFGEIPKPFRETVERYFDFESYARDMESAGDVTTARANGRVLVFWNR
jgi:antirestriction protein